MNDIVEYSLDKQFKLVIWETNKGPTLGYVRWAIYRWYPELEWWGKVDGRMWPHTLDRALRDGRMALKRQIEKTREEYSDG